MIRARPFSKTRKITGLGSSVSGTQSPRPKIQRNPGFSCGHVQAKPQCPGFSVVGTVHPAPYAIREWLTLRTCKSLVFHAVMNRECCTVQDHLYAHLRPCPVRGGQAVRTREMLAFRTMRDRKSCPVQDSLWTGPHIVPRIQYANAMPPDSTKFRFSDRYTTRDTGKAGRYGISVRSCTRYAVRFLLHRRITPPPLGGGGVSRRFPVQYRSSWLPYADSYDLFSPPRVGGDSGEGDLCESAECRVFVR